MGTAGSTRTVSAAWTSTGTGRASGSRSTSRAAPGPIPSRSRRPGRWPSSSFPIGTSPASSTTTWRGTSSTGRPRPCISIRSPGKNNPMSQADLAVLEFFGAKYTELINGQDVTPVFGRGGPPRYGAIWGVMIGWGYDHYGVPSWVPEMGSYAPFCDYDEDGNAIGNRSDSAGTTPRWTGRSSWTGSPSIIPSWERWRSGDGFPRSTIRTEEPTRTP